MKIKKWILENLQLEIGYGDSKWELTQSLACVTHKHLWNRSSIICRKYASFFINPIQDHFDIFQVVTMWKKARELGFDGENDDIWEWFIMQLQWIGISLSQLEDKIRWNGALSHGQIDVSEIYMMIYRFL